MSANPYAPPKADVADIANVIEAQAAPPLWNPNAAANWSLLFSPVFGAFLHMKNWQALGQPEKAAASRRWVIAGVVMFTAVALISGFFSTEAGMDGATRAIAFGFLAGWYFSSARHQAVYVKARFGTTYPRRGWAKPLLLTLLALVVFLVALVAFGFGVGMLLGET